MVFNMTEKQALTMIGLLKNISSRLTIVEERLRIKNNKDKDRYIDEYLKKENIINIKDYETKVVYHNYTEERKMFGITAEMNDVCSTIRKFNKKVREYYPYLYIEHINRDGRNVYYWKVKR